MHLGGQKEGAEKKRFCHGLVLRLNESSCAGLNCFQIKTKKSAQEDKKSAKKVEDGEKAQETLLK